MWLADLPPQDPSVLASLNKPRVVVVEIFQPVCDIGCKFDQGSDMLKALAELVSPSTSTAAAPPVLPISS
jgi:hypothetical protein